VKLRDLLRSAANPEAQYRVVSVTSDTFIVKSIISGARQALPLTELHRFETWTVDGMRTFELHTMGAKP
jgi:phosphatidate phosphatase APP1